MDQKRLHKFRRTLETRQKELRQRLGVSQKERRAAHEDGSDEGDRATSSHAKELLFHENVQQQRLLNAVEAALKRIREGTFGECLNCGQEIGAKRLEAVPWTRYCITCQELLEQQR